MSGTDGKERRQGLLVSFLIVEFTLFRTAVVRLSVRRLQEINLNYYYCRAELEQKSIVSNINEIQWHQNVPIFPVPPFHTNRWIISKYSITEKKSLHF